MRSLQKFSWLLQVFLREMKGVGHIGVHVLSGSQYRDGYVAIFVPVPARHSDALINELVDVSSKFLGGRMTAHEECGE